MGQVSAPKQNQKCPGADYGMFYDLGVEVGPQSGFQVWAQNTFLGGKIF